MLQKHPFTTFVSLACFGLPFDSIDLTKNNETGCNHLFSYVFYNFDICNFVQLGSFPPASNIGELGLTKHSRYIAFFQM